MPKNQKPLWISNSTWLTKPAVNAIVRLAARYSSDRDAYRYFSASVGPGLDQRAVAAVAARGGGHAAAGDCGHGAPRPAGDFASAHTA